MNAGVLAPSAAAVRRNLGFLPLPLPDEPFAPRSGLPHKDFGVRPLLAPEDEAERAYHRWLLGHHVALCVWRRLAEVLTRMYREGVHDALLDEAAVWFDRYSAMFVYAGSCGEVLYRTVIRTSMAAANPAFSGVWARDYTYLQQLLHGLDVPPDSSLKRAVKSNRLVHMKIGKALVPEGESLLKESGRRAGDGALPAEEDMFDSYFQVDRGPVGEDVFMAHAVHRADAAARDLEQHPIDLPELAPVLDLVPGEVTTLVRDIVSAFVPAERGDAA
ncbi:hypothetical protein [Lentzea sp. E54]|uniref:hypothetical protein n=1 Tax=Lentzea xerophila TaxID=3435883 RepID=UPI003DA503FC